LKREVCDNCTEVNRIICEAKHRQIGHIINRSNEEVHGLVYEELMFVINFTAESLIRNNFCLIPESTLINQLRSQ
jgi:hypothetical protein